MSSFLDLFVIFVALSSSMYTTSQERYVYKVHFFVGLAVVCLFFSGECLGAIEEQDTLNPKPQSVKPLNPKPLKPQ